jgi:DNA mismatch repair ATPase MutS
MFVLEELGLLEVFNLKNSDLDEYFTTNPKVIEHRMAVFSDMLEFPQISVTLNRLIPILTDIMELRRLEADFGDNTESYLESITEIELYIASISTLHDGFADIGDKVKSDAFKALAKRINDLVCSEYYSELNAKLSELTNRVRDIKSVTIGVNLDAQLRPSSAGVLSINPESFRSGDVLDKILRLNFKDDEYTCIANLVPFNKKQSENQRTALSLAFNSAINDVYKQSLRSWKKIVQSFVLENTDFLLNLMPEIEFLVKGTNLLRALKEKGLTLCKPEIVTDKNVFVANEIYNPCVALKVDDEIITNDVEFKNDIMIFVLTGPNRGGKSVITCAIGLAQAMLQLGMFVPASSAEISIADGIYTHFPTGADDTIDKGRLGEECARLRDIFEDVTRDSLVLLDESLSSTGSYEASYIAAEVLAGFSRIGCRCLFSTHLHELAAEIDNINARTAADGGTKIDSLVAGIEDGKRSFKIYRMKPDGKSYARDIADKYGLSYENIVATALDKH